MISERDTQIASIAIANKLCGYKNLRPVVRCWIYCLLLRKKIITKARKIENTKRMSVTGMVS